MLRIVDSFNLVVTKLFAILFYPLRSLPPFWSLTIISVVTGLLMLWFFAKFSDQVGIGKIKNKMGAQLLAIRIFNENLLVFLRIQVRLFKHSFVYLGHMLKPMSVMLLPILILLVQLNLHYAKMPLAVDGTALVKVKVTDPRLLHDPSNLSLKANDGIVVEVDGVRIPLENEKVWRIKAKLPGVHEMTLISEDSLIKKTLQVGEGDTAVSEMRIGSNTWKCLLYPGERSIDPASGIESIEVIYPDADIDLFGWKISWLVLFIVMSILSGFLLKGFFGIRI